MSLITLLALAGFASAANASDTSPRPTVAGLTAEKICRKYKSHGSTVEYCIPRFTGGTALVTQKLNSDVDKMLHDNVEKNLEGNKVTNKPGSRWAFSYKQGVVSPHTVSMLFSSFVSIGGLAHGSGRRIFFNKDLDHGLNDIKLRDVVGSDANYKKLTDLLAAQLKRGDYMDLQVDGRELCKPEDASFTILPGGIQWSYGSYEIGSYITGEPTATLSWGTIQTAVNSAYLPSFKKWLANNGLVQTTKPTK